jgi:hypothetical protein
MPSSVRFDAAMPARVDQKDAAGLRIRRSAEHFGETPESREVVLDQRKLARHQASRLGEREEQCVAVDDLGTRIGRFGLLRFEAEGPCEPVHVVKLRPDASRAAGIEPVRQEEAAREQIHRAHQRAVNLPFSAEREPRARRLQDRSTVAGAELL